MPSAPAPIGATTGMKPPASSAWITAGSIDSISPTWPRSTWPFSLDGSSIFRARMNAPSWPVRPTALPPAWLMSSTTSLFTWPPSTISTTSMVSASVTRMPWMNSPFLPSRARSCSICGPPPCTTTGFMPTSLRSTTSWAKLRFSSSSIMALPPDFTTIVLPWKRWMYGSASARMRAFSAACGLCTKGAFMGRAHSTNKRKGERRALAGLFADARRLLDGNLLALRRRLLRQRELQHAVAEFRLGFRLVDLLRQGEGAARLAEDALGVQHAFVLRRLALALHLGGERHLRAVDRHLDVFFLHAGQLRGHRIGAVTLRDVDLHAGQRLVTALIGQGADQEALEQVVDQLVEGVEPLHARHMAVSFCSGAPAPDRRQVGAARAISRAPLHFADEGLGVRPMRGGVLVRRERGGLLVRGAAAARADTRARLPVPRVPRARAQRT